MRSNFEKINIILKKLNQKTPCDEQRLRSLNITFDEFHWATLLVASRSFRVTLIQDNIVYEQSLMLVPIADLLDHKIIQLQLHSNNKSTYSSNVRWYINSTNQAFAMKTELPVAANETVYGYYGPKCNSLLLTHYGFVLPFNPYNEAQFSIDLTAYAHNSQFLKRLSLVFALFIEGDRFSPCKITDLRSTNVSCVLNLDDNNFHDSMQSLLVLFRILFANDKEFDTLRNRVDFDCLLDMPTLLFNSEVETLTQLAQALKVSANRLIDTVNSITATNKIDELVSKQLLGEASVLTHWSKLVEDNLEYALNEYFASNQRKANIINQYLWNWACFAG